MRQFTEQTQATFLSPSLNNSSIEVKDLKSRKVLTDLLNDQIERNEVLYPS